MLGSILGVKRSTGVSPTLPTSPDVNGSGPVELRCLSHLTALTDCLSFKAGSGGAVTGNNLLGTTVLCLQILQECSRASWGSQRQVSPQQFLAEDGGSGHGQHPPHCGLTGQEPSAAERCSRAAVSQPAGKAKEKAMREHCPEVTHRAGRCEGRYGGGGRGSSALPAAGGSERDVRCSYTAAAVTPNSAMGVRVAAPCW